MAGVLNINDAADLHVEDGEPVVARRMCRGFGPGQKRDHENVERYNSVDTGEHEKVRGYDSVDTKEHVQELEPQRSSDIWVMFLIFLHNQGSDEDIREALSKFGPIKDLLVKLEHCTGCLRSYVWFEYSTPQQAEAAYKAYRRYEIPGHSKVGGWLGHSKYTRRMSNRSYVHTVYNLN